MISFIALSAYLLLVVGEISFGQQAFFAVSAYGSGIATAMWGWPIWLGLLWGALLAGVPRRLVVAIPTVRLRGLYFSVATLAFAEMVRLVFEIFTYQVEIDGELVGPDGSDGFRDIRAIYDSNVSAFEYMLIIYGLLAVVLIGLPHPRALAARRHLPHDRRGPHADRDAGAERQPAYKILAVVMAGVVAGIGGALYAHLDDLRRAQDLQRDAGGARARLRPDRGAGHGLRAA